MGAQELERAEHPPTLLSTAETCGLGKDGAIAKPQSACVECVSLEDRVGAFYEAAHQLVSGFDVGDHLRSFLAFVVGDVQVTGTSIRTSELYRDPIDWPRNGKPHHRSIPDGGACYE